MTANAFDLADRLQAPVIVMSDLDLGMNSHLCDPLEWDDNRTYDRGKVMSAEALDALQKPWGRYLDVDGDGICYRTYPGTHPEKGAYTTRGTSHNEYAAYTEESQAYERGMKRLLVKWETARGLVPCPEINIRDKKSKIGALYFGTTTHAAQEALDQLADQSILINEMRILAYPFQKEVFDFIDQHDLVFTIEQNRDAQMKTLLAGECLVSPGKLDSVTHFNGLPITATIITNQIHSTLLTRRRDLYPASLAQEENA